MSKTYLITGATSPLGLALMGRLLPALEEGDLILAQGCGDLARLAGLCQARPGFIRPYDADFTQPLAVRAFLSDLTDTYPTPTHLVHLAGLRPIEAPLGQHPAGRFERAGPFPGRRVRFRRRHRQLHRPRPDGLRCPGGRRRLYPRPGCRPARLFAQRGRRSPHRRHPAGRPILTH